jgi:DNA-directed RNA polymerase specialized sigma24 family protein
VVDFRATAWSCSFCGTQGGKETRLAGGLGAMICMECLTYYYQTFADTEATQAIASPPWAQMTDAELLSKLPLIAVTSTQVDRFLREWVKMIRERNISYAEIGKALGVSRQAAWERFSRVLDAADAADAEDRAHG